MDSIGLYKNKTLVGIISNVKITPQAEGQKSGITLVEVMVGMVVIAIVFLSTMATLDIGFTASQNARLNADAQFFLENEVERLRAMNWTELETLKSSYESNKEQGASTAFGATPTNDKLTSDLTIGYRDSRTDQMEVLLQVTWTDKKGKLHEANMVTLITRSGISAS